MPGRLQELHYILVRLICRKTQANGLAKLMLLEFEYLDWLWLEMCWACLLLLLRSVFLHTERRGEYLMRTSPSALPVPACAEPWQVAQRCEHFLTAAVSTLTPLHRLASAPFGPLADPPLRPAGSVGSWMDSLPWQGKSPFTDPRARPQKELKQHC